MLIRPKNIGFWIVFAIYIIALFADITTTFMVKQNHILETNPIYKYVGFVGIIFLNIFVAWLLWFLYSRPNTSPASRFLLILCMLMIISVRIYAVQNAVYFIENPVTDEEAYMIATPEAKLETTKQIVYMAYPPFIFSIIGFFFWKLDHKLEKK